MRRNVIVINTVTKPNEEARLVSRGKLDTKNTIYLEESSLWDLDFCAMNLTKFRAVQHTAIEYCRLAVAG